MVVSEAGHEVQPIVVSELDEHRVLDPVVAHLQPLQRREARPTAQMPASSSTKSMNEAVCLEAIDAAHI